MMKTKKEIRDEQNGLTYTLDGDYYIPNLTVDEPNPQSIGVWGRLHRDYLQESSSLLYNQLLLNGRLYEYLADLNEQAQTRFDLIIQQMKINENVTDTLKKKDAMEWVRCMNSIRNRAEEIVLREMIYR